MLQFIKNLFGKKPKTYHNNAVKKLSLYRMHNTWLFDDKHLGIIAEPFVPSASDVITELVDRYVMKGGVRADILIGEDLEEYDAEIVLDESNPSATYLYEGKSLWLCSVLLKFFPIPPKRIRVLFL